MTDDSGDLALPSGAPACGRQPLVEAITRFLAHGHAPGIREIRASLERTIDEAGPDAIDGLVMRLAEAGSDWRYYPSDPLARRIHHVLASQVLQHEPIVTGVEHLEAVADEPLLIYANHLSYSDANAVDVLLQRAGCGRIAGRLTVMAGPKVYSNVRRRFSSLCFGTIKTPQNRARSSEEAVMTARAVARAAQRTICIAHERLRLGEALLIFPEGTRSRSGAMQQLLSGAARYLESADAWVVPMGLTGTERLFPMTEDGLIPVPITLRIGRPVRAHHLERRAAGDRRIMMDDIGKAIAELLPSEYQGGYAEGARC